ncbi:MAG TPA: hypothetical protein VGL81_20190 [Polyangiaceae bacterium]|jgi:hypothetical protein
MATKRTPAQIWKDLEKEARDDEEIERLASMSEAALDEELAAGGFDPKKERAEAREAVADLERAVVARRVKQAEAGARVRSMKPPRKRPLALWVAAAAVAATATGGLVYALTHPGGAPPEQPSTPAPSSSPAPEPPSQRLIAASQLRTRAFAECEAQHWDTCLARFDDARMLDPAGDAAPEVQAARTKAEDELHRKH